VGRFVSEQRMLCSAPALDAGLLRVRVAPLSRARVAALAARVVGARVVVAALPVVGLLLGLILITAGCGPPN
jgi:hypothetical protein